MADLATLRERDASWDYSGEFTKRYTHGLHTYPAMMIPQVAARLIEQYTQPGDTILDPFCGSGSVLVEAAALGRNAWGIDLNPLAVLVARVKTSVLDQKELARGLGSITAALPQLLSEPPPPPSVPRITFWFKPRVIRQLSALKAAIDDLWPESVRDFFFVAFSEVVRLASNTRSSEFKLYRYAPQRLAMHDPDAVSMFFDRVARNTEAMSTFAATCSSGSRVRVVRANSMMPVNELALGSVDAIITSPPYGDSRTTVAYGQFSRLSAQWLGLDEGRDLDRELLGGHPRPHRDQVLLSAHLERAVEAVAATDRIRAEEVHTFYADIYPCLKQLTRYLRPAGYACIVIGNRRVKGIQLPTDLIIAELGSTVGLMPERVIVRRIPSKRMPLRNSPTNVVGATAETMHNEFIVILRKTEGSGDAR